MKYNPHPLRHFEIFARHSRGPHFNDHSGGNSKEYRKLRMSRPNSLCEAKKPCPSAYRGRDRSPLECLLVEAFILILTIRSILQVCSIWKRRAVQRHELRFSPGQAVIRCNSTHLEQRHWYFSSFGRLVWPHLAQMNVPST
jgi:hypothetical protein